LLVVTVPKLVVLYPLLLLLYSLYSYAHVGVNMVLSSHPQVFQIQQALQRFGLEQRLESTLIYTGLIMLIFVSYLGLKHQIETGRLKTRTMSKLLVASIAALFIAYPGMSNDIFNYLFNAKMVIWYQANPHDAVALDFPDDPWLPYMHNIHTPAPYGYGWTALSLIPTLVGQEHLKLTILLFRLMMIGALVGMAIVQMKLLPPKDHKFIWILMLNPLVLIETVGNIHNDVVMMWLLFLAYFWFKKALESKRYVYGFVAAGLFLLSVSIKFASVLFLAGYVLMVISQKLKRRISFGSAQSISHFAPLLTARSQVFLPWYLIWPLSFFAFVKEPLVRDLLLVFSLSALLSYLPFLYLGEYSSMMLLYRSLIIFILPIGFLFGKVVMKQLKANDSQGKPSTLK
jgi:hypothetical protein